MGENTAPNLDWINTQLADAPELTDEAARRICLRLWGAQ